MKYNKKASRETVEKSIIAAPLTSAQPIDPRTQHIPPIEISSGSVILQTQGDVTGPSPAEPKTQVFAEEHHEIKGVRVIMTDGTIKADYKDDPEVIGGQIHIWVKNLNTRPDMVLSTPNSNTRLQVKFDNGDNIKFGDRSNGSHGRQRRQYSEPTASFLMVKILDSHGSPLVVVTTDEKAEKVIDRILIWTKKAG